jgi:hypothetical protein
MPTQEETREWIEFAEKRIREEEEKIKAGRATQLDWEGWSEWQLELGRARFLYGEELPRVREAFQKAGQGVVEIFAMAYDTASPSFLGERSIPGVATFVRAIDGFNAGLMAGDEGLTQRLARLVPAQPSSKLTPKEVINYVHGLKHSMLGEREEALISLRENLERLGHRMPKESYKRNFFSLTLTLAGVIEGDDARFNEGLRLQSQFHRGRAMGECADTSEEYICDHLVALGRLGRRRGLRVSDDLPYLPTALLAE